MEEWKVTRANLLLREFQFFPGLQEGNFNLG